MDYPSSVNILQRQTYLDEPIKNLCFREMLIIFQLSLYVIIKVTNFTIFHDYYQHLKREIALFIRHNIWVVKIFKKVDLEHGTFLFFLFKTRQHHFFGHVRFLL